MQEIKVKINEKQKDYTIFIGTKIIQNLTSLIDCASYSNALIVTDKNIPQELLRQLQLVLPIKSAKVFLQSGDKQKNIENVQKIWQALLDFGCDRKSLVINIGGGAIGDLGGFAASTYMRGLDFLQIPTTLLSQVDASVGGKVGINFEGIKNLVGTFQQPIAVIIDVDTLVSLPKREFISGFAEIIKHGIISDKEYLQIVTSKKPEDYSKKELVEIIKKSCQIKANIISADEKEEGSRKLLNFGHTIGHAIESLSLNSDFPLLHGEAISIGMFIEAKISKALGLISSKDLELIKNVLLNAGLPVSFIKFKTEDILSRIKSDKKNIKGKVNFTLLKGIGQAIYDQTPSESIISQALKGD